MYAQSCNPQQHVSKKFVIYKNNYCIQQSKNLFYTEVNRELGHGLDFGEVMNDSGWRLIYSSINFNASAEMTPKLRPFMFSDIDYSKRVSSRC